MQAEFSRRSCSTHLSAPASLFASALASFQASSTAEVSLQFQRTVTGSRAGDTGGAVKLATYVDESGLMVAGIDHVDDTYFTEYQFERDEFNVVKVTKSPRLRTRFDLCFHVVHYCCRCSSSSSFVFYFLVADGVGVGVGVDRFSMRRQLRNILRT